MPATVVAIAADSFFAGSTILTFIGLPWCSSWLPAPLSRYFSDRQYLAHRNYANVSIFVSPAGRAPARPAPASAALLSDSQPSPSRPPSPRQHLFPDNGSSPDCNTHMLARHYQDTDTTGRADRRPNEQIMGTGCTPDRFP